MNSVQEGKVTGIVKDIIPAILDTLGMQGIRVTYSGYRSYDDMVAAISKGDIDIAFPVGGGLYSYSFLDMLLDHIALVGFLLLALAAIVVVFLIRDTQRTKKEIREKESAPWMIKKSRISPSLRLPPTLSKKTVRLPWRQE